MPLILLPKEYDEIEKQFDPTDRVVVTTCAMCPVESGVYKKVREYAKKLSHKCKVVDIIEYPSGCIRNFLEEYKRRVLSRNPTAILVMDCDLAVELHKMLYPNLKVVGGLKTIGLGRIDPEERVFELVVPFKGMENYRGLKLRLFEGDIIEGGGG